MPTPTKTKRLEALATLVASLKNAVPEAKLIGNGAASKSGSAGSLLDKANALAALNGGALAEQIFLDEGGKKRSQPDSDRVAGFAKLSAAQRFLVEMNGKDVATAKSQASKAHFRLFVAKDVNYDAPGELVEPDNFRVIYNNVKATTGQGVGDLITDESEAGNLATKPEQKARRVWLYVCVGEVEDFRTDVFKAATKAGLVAGKNEDDETGNNNVRFWDPKWAEILTKHMKAIWKTHSAKQPLAGFMLDVLDSWMRADDTWN